MKMVQDQSAGELPLAWRSRGAIGAIVIGGGVMAAANAESLGILGVDFSPGQRRPRSTPRHHRTAARPHPAG